MLAPWCEFENAEEPVLRHGQAAIDWWDRRAGGVTRNGTLVLKFHLRNSKKEQRKRFLARLDEPEKRWKFSASDIAAGHVLAMDRGQPGRKYIFATAFLTFDEIMAMFARVTGQTRRPRCLPHWLAAITAGAAERVLPVVAPRREQLLTSAAVRILRMGSGQLLCTCVRYELAEMLSLGL